MYCPYRLCIINCPFLRNWQIKPHMCSSMRGFPRRDFVTVAAKEIKYQKPFIQADLKIPEFHGIANKNVQAYINNFIQSDIVEFNREMEAAAQEYGNKAAQSEVNFIPYAISSVYELTYNKNNILSISILYNEYVEGRNSYIKVPYNFDITTGRSLMLQDIFTPGTDYKSLINKEIRNELIKNKQKYYPKTTENFKGVAEDQPFYLENGYLTVFFGFHEIAPTEAKIPVFKIPLSSFGNAIRPAFR